MLNAEGYEAISSSAEHDQHFFPSKRSASGAQGQAPLQIISPEFVRTYHSQVHEIVDALTATVTGAQAGLNWLRREPPDLEEVRQALNDIASAGRRAAEIVTRLRALIEKVPTADGVSCSLTVR